MTTELLDIAPLYPDDTEATVVNRLLGYVNEGVAPTEPTFVDDREGSIARTLLTPPGREFARVYDLMGTEVIAGVNPATAWGDFLDEWADVLSMERLAATVATGEVTFLGTNGVTITAGTTVGAEPVSDEDDAPEYVVTTDGVISGGSVTLPVQCTEAGDFGNIASHAIVVLLTPNPDVTDIDNDDPFTGGTDVQTDEALLKRIVEALQGGGPGTVPGYRKLVLARPGIGSVTVAAVYDGPGTVGIIVADPDGDPPSQGTLDDLQNYLDPAVYEGELTTDYDCGVDATMNVDSTAGARDLGIVRVGTQLVTYTGKTGTTFTGCTGGTGTVVTGEAVTQGGGGNGAGEIGHHISVMAAGALAVAITADSFEFEEGYALDGTDGDISLRSTITEAIENYVASVPPGGTIVRNRIIAVIMEVDGVVDCDNVEIDAALLNVAVGLNPPEIATATVTLS